MREIPGVEGAEDIVVIPGTDWVITSAMTGHDFARPRSFFVNIRTHELRAAWPENFTVDLDRARFGDIAPPDVYSFHGIDVIRRDGIVELYAVNHPSEDGKGGRESVEVFEIDLPASGPALRWRGAVPGPAWLGGNDLCCFPEGGFAITNFCYPGPENMPMGFAGAITGNVVEWRNREEGWRIVPGTDLCFPNGIALAPGGDAYFIAVWGAKTVVRVPRGNSKVARAEIPMAGMIDNITWTPDGAMLACVQVDEVANLIRRAAAGETMYTPFQAVRIDPVTLEARILLDEDIPGYFPTTALQVGEREIWVSSHFDQRILAFDI